MSDRWQLERHGWLLQLRFSRQLALQPETIVEALNDAATAYDSQTTTGMLFDFRGVRTSPRLDSTAIERIVTLVETSKEAITRLRKVAVVVDPLLNQHELRVHQELAGRLPQTHRYFRDYEQAMAWLST